MRQKSVLGTYFSTLMVARKLAIPSISSLYTVHTRDPQSVVQIWSMLIAVFSFPGLWYVHESQCMIGKLFAHLTPSLHRHALYLLQVREVFNKASPVLLIRFLGTSPDSSTIQPLLHSLCVQISYLYDQPIEDIPSDLVLLQVRQIHRNQPFVVLETFLNSKVITLYMY